MDGFYRAVRVVGRFWLWFFFRSVDVRHPERVPAVGAVLLCINHPNNFIDSLLVGGALRRKVHYLATAALFPLALTREHAARRLTTERQALIAELERAKNDYLAATKGSSV
jgi:1-acyl-sn-glycerol-3-phosphate acyltransferase